MKKFFAEFKKFITRGNVLDLAVGVIVGGAFTAIVNSLSNNIIRPLINWLIALVGGKDGLASAVTFLSKATKVENGETVVDLANSIYIDWGAFIAAIIDFFIIAFTIFMIIKLINTYTDKMKELSNFIQKESKKEVIEAKKAAKKQAKSEGRKFKEVWAEMEAEKAKKAAEEAAAKEAEAKRLAEEEAINNPSQEALLKEIRDLLKASVKQTSKK